ncbi:hypothetical protein JYT85_02255 [Desulfocapsa sp. AH-315-G09]|nr:hypothetical protein [bacterium AH-315-I07]MBN4065450.1 hypothetical protein [Desulfocapsa sp. AH-315-G09]
MEKQVLVVGDTTAGIACIKVKFNVASAKILSGFYAILDQLGVSLGDVY